ncbi:MAG: FHA domain-containing protein [Kiritimatiellae bacterium]|nr:FHA domain-containing protein [Kiritimatiellia bacterium]
MKRFIIRLEYKGRIIHEIGTWEIHEEIQIGRGRNCAWRTNKDDAIISSCHASLVRKGRNLWIHDHESKNGVFCRGRRITKHKVKLGDQFGIGNHVLFAHDDKSAISADTLSEIVVLTGKSNVRKALLRPPALTMGSDPECGLILIDTLISRKHAEVSVKDDGSCWIRDLNSKNGTSVNELPLRDDKERLLKDGDRISIAHLELEFHDGKMKKTSSQAWLRLGVMAATLVIALVLYNTYRCFRPSARTYMDEAKQLSSNLKFSEATDLLDKALDARKKGVREVEINELRGLIRLWQATTAKWQAARRALAEGDWTSASRNLGMLQAEQKEAWGWHRNGMLEKTKATEVKTMLDALLHASGLIRREDTTSAELQQSYDAVQEALNRSSTIEEYLQKLQFDLEEVQEKLAGVIKEMHGLETAVSKLKQPHPPYDEIVRSIQQIVDESDGALKRRAILLQEPIEGLARGFAQLNAMADHVRAMEFDKIATVKLKLPSVDACTIDRRISQARINLEKIFHALEDSAMRVAYLHKDARKYLTDKNEPKGLLSLSSPRVMTAVFSCDALKKSFPKRSRKIPVGRYDKVLGIEEFFERLRTLPEEVDLVIVSQWPFVPELTESRKLLIKIRQMREFFAKPNNRWLLGGKIARELKIMSAIEIKRDAVVNDMLRKAKAGSGRIALIAGGIAFQLSTSKTKPKINDIQLDKWLIAELKKNRAATFKLNKEYTLAEPQRQIEIRSQILEIGLPGDPIVRRMWVMLSATRERK